MSEYTFFIHVLLTTSLVTKYGREYSDFKEPNKIKYFSYLPTHPKNSESPEGKPTYFLIFAGK